MKIKNYLLGFSLIAVQAANAQCRVEAGENRAVVCGDSVQLYGEPNWSSGIDETQARLHGVFFVNSDMGFTVGDNGAIRKTIDGGITWTAQTASGNPSLNSVFFLNADVGYVAGTGIYKTLDGGATWTQQTLSSTDKLNTIYFLDVNIGFAVGDNGKLFKTINGGTDWIQKTTNTTERLATISFPSVNVGYVCTGKAVLKTIDGGETWSQIATGTNQYFALFFTDVNTGYVTGQDATNKFVFKTVDAGTTWTKYKIDWHNGLVCIFFTDTNTGYIGSVSRLFKTTDGGKNWRGESGPMMTESIHFPNSKVGYAVVYNGNPFLLKQTLKYMMPDAVSWTPALGLSSTTSLSPVARPAVTTTYKITTTTGTCVIVDSIKITVNPLEVNAGNDKTIICGGSLQLNDLTTNYTGTAPLAYSWTPATGLNATNIANPTVTIKQNTKYYVTVTTSNGCTATDSIEVIVNPLIANAGSDKIHVCGSAVQLDTVSSNYTGTTALSYSWLPITGLNSTSVPNPISTASGITYTVTITTTNGCMASDEVQVGLTKMSALEICMVGVDSTGKNVVIWNKPASTATDSVYIWRETTVSGNYVKVGSVSSSKNVFKDASSVPDVKSNKYKLSLLDSCGQETAQSSAHKTMHLAITKGIGTSWNLIWESYEGFAVPTYNIYRGTNKSDLQFLDATSGGSNQYTNYNPPPGDLFYQVEVVNPNPCIISSLTGPLRSNVSRNLTVGINEQENESFAFLIYPNPANEFITLTIDNSGIKNSTITMYNTIGSVVKTVILEQNQQQINTSDLANGFYTIELKSENRIAQKKFIIQK